MYPSRTIKWSKDAGMSIEYLRSNASDFALWMGYSHIQVLYFKHKDFAPEELCVDSTRFQDHVPAPWEPRIITEVALLFIQTSRFGYPVFALLLPANSFGEHAHCCCQHYERLRGSYRAVILK